MAILSTSTLQHDSVYNPQGEKLGDIKDFVVDTDDGRIAYAVLSFGGLFGLGDKLFALPMDALTVDTENERFVCNVSKEQLENAPGFDKDDWPRVSDRSYINDLHAHYGYDPYYTTA